MKKLFVSALTMLAVALGFTACSSDDELVNETPQGQKVTICASTGEDGLATRTALEQDGDKYKVVWSEGDKISVGGNLFTLTSGAGTTNGTFDGVASLKESFYDVYYPSTYDGTTATWPTDQDYVENNIPQGVPMKANVLVLNGQVISGKKLGDLDDGGVSGSSIKFYNEGGILRLNLKGETKVSYITVNATGLGRWGIIALICDEPVQLNSETATPFHIAVPATDEGTNYNNLKITIYDEEYKKVCTKTAKSDITVKRSMITDINLTANRPITTGIAKTKDGKDVPWVQLWENGPKFAAYNIGASKPEEYGGYYCWGDITNKRTGGYTFEGPEAPLSSNYDTATRLWGENWRMPTQSELILLMCCNAYEEEYDNGCKGLKFSGQYNTPYESNSIFLPYASLWDSGIEDFESYDKIVGFYWTSTPAFFSMEQWSYYLQVSSMYATFVRDNSVRFGCSVRAVLNETPVSE